MIKETITVWVLDSSSLECGVIFKGNARKIDEDSVELLIGEAPSVLYGKGVEWYETESEALREFQVRKKKRIESLKRRMENMRQEVIRLGKIEPEVIEVKPKF